MPSKTKTEIRLSAQDFTGDGTPEVVVEFYKNGEMEYALSVSDTNKDGKFDTVSGEVDVDGKPGHQKRDDAVVIALVRAFMKFKL